MPTRLHALMTLEAYERSAVDHSRLNPSYSQVNVGVWDTVNAGVRTVSISKIPQLKKWQTSSIHNPLTSPTAILLVARLTFPDLAAKLTNRFCFVPPFAICCLFSLHKSLVHSHRPRGAIFSIDLQSRWNYFLTAACLPLSIM